VRSQEGTVKRAVVVAAIGVALTVGSAVSAPSRAAVQIQNCQSRRLHLRASFYGEAGGQFIQTFTFTNAGAMPCRLAGWPTLRLRNPSGQATAVRSIRVVQNRPSSRPFEPVILQPGGAASFDVFGADWNVSANRACPNTHALSIALPGVAALAIRVALPHCGPFSIAPVVAGKTDRDAWSAVWAKRWCSIQQFSVTIGRRISEATGQHTLALRLTNRGAACTLYGTPALWFEDAQGHIPFEIRTGTDQMIAAAYPLPVQVRRGGSAWAVINHYRCDLGGKRAASVIRIGLQGAASANAARLVIRNPYERVDYCGKGDPGSTITVSPFEPTLTAAFHR
jgi:hypothetical protein